LIEARLDMKANREFKYLLPLDDEIADRMKPVSKHFPMRHKCRHQRRAWSSSRKEPGSTDRGAPPINDIELS